jgi:hypothetical protein
MIHYKTIVKHADVHVSAHPDFPHDDAPFEEWALWGAQLEHGLIFHDPPWVVERIAELPQGEQTPNLILLHDILSRLIVEDDPAVVTLY